MTIHGLVFLGPNDYICCRSPIENRDVMQNRTSALVIRFKSHTKVKFEVCKSFSYFARRFISIQASISILFSFKEL